MLSSPCVIVGGGPAGISTALFLAHAAPELRERIVVIEKERYPRDKVCAGAVGGRAEQLLRSIGVVVDVPGVPIAGLSLRCGGETRTVRESNVGRVVRRIEFDEALADAARRRGISVRDGVRAVSFDVRPERVVVRTSEGDIPACSVVGADGVTSVVRRAMLVPASPYVGQGLEVDTEPVSSDAPRDLLHFDFGRGAFRGYYWDFPTLVDGRQAVSRGVYALKSRTRVEAGSHIEIEDVLAAALRERGLELSSYRKRRYAERGFLTSGVLSRPRLLLVGEAAGIDPLTGEGIAQAIQFGAIAGKYLAARMREGDFDFADWKGAVRTSAVGRDLLVRTHALPLAYGPLRTKVERFVLDTPQFLEVGLRHFGGKPWSKRTTSGLLTRAGVAVAKSLFTR